MRPLAPLRIRADAAASGRLVRPEARVLPSPSSSGSLPPAPPERQTGSALLFNRILLIELKLGDRQDAGKEPESGVWGDGENWGKR